MARSSFLETPIWMAAVELTVVLSSPGCECTLNGGFAVRIAIRQFLRPSKELSVLLG